MWQVSLAFESLGPVAISINLKIGALLLTVERQGDIFTAFSTGLCVGAFTWGILVDVIGRKWQVYMPGFHRGPL